MSWWAIALSLGIVAAWACEASPRVAIWVALVAAPAAFAAAHRRRLAVAEAVLAIALGVLAGARALQAPVAPAALAAVIDTDRRVVVSGWVLVAPEPAHGGSKLRMAMERVDGEPAQGSLALVVAAGVPALLPGDAISVRARVRSVRGLANPGVADTALQARAAGVDLFAGVGSASAIARIEAGRMDFSPPPYAIVLRGAATVRAALGRAIDQVAGGAAATFLHTAVLGERRGNDPAVEEGFRAAGATHVLSVSGLHLAAVALVFFAGLRRALAAVPRLPLWFAPRAAAALLALPAIGFYTAVTGGAIATVRSALMMSVALLGVVVGRPNTALVAIAAAVVALLGWSPAMLADVSFQLSVVSVTALALLVPRLVPAGKGGDGLGHRAARWAGRFGAAAGAAGLTTGPIVAHHFGEVTPAAPLGNLLLVPLVEMVIVPCGLAGAALGATLGRSWGLPLLTVARWASQAALAVAAFFRVHAPVWLTRSPNALETAALSLGIACLLASIRREQAWRRRTALVGLVLIAGAAGSLVARELGRRWDPNLVVTFLDIGQGDAAVVQAPGGRTLLIDGGGTYDGSFDPGARVVEPFLRARGITRLDAIALSHPHPDHLGGLHRIVARFPVDLLWTAGDDGRNPDYLRLLAEARAHDVALPVPARWQAGATVIDALGPFVGAGADGVGEHIGPPEGTTVNDASLVLRLSFAGRAVLFTGDIEANGEGELLGRASIGHAVASDVLKVPHHGSRTSSSDELLDVVRPRIGVMSLGWRNRFHFPRPEVVQRYRERGIRLLRTDLHGAVTVTIGPGGDLTATCARGCR